MDNLLIKLFAEPANNESSIVYFCRALHEAHQAAKLGTVLVDLLRSVGFPMSSAMDGIDQSDLSKIVDVIEDNFDLNVFALAQAKTDTKEEETVSSTLFKASTTNRDRCFYFLKEKISLIVDLARLSFARINENISETSMRYSDLLGPSAKVMRNNKFGYYIKVAVQVGMRRDIEDIIKEKVIYKEEVYSVNASILSSWFSRPKP